MRPVVVAVVLALSLVPLVAPQHLDAQRVGPPRVAGAQPEVRVDALGARAPTLEFGVGANVPAGLYVRLGLLAAGGSAWRRGSSRSAARVDATTRFLLDPFRESRVGLYGVGGVSAMYDGFEKWRARLLVGFGLEGPASHGRISSLEVALGGGLRVGLVVRRSREGRR